MASPQVTPQTVEFDVIHENGQRLGSLVSWALPTRGDLVRVYPPGDPDRRDWEVVRAEFDPDNITVIVRDPATPPPSSGVTEQGTFG